MSTQEFDLKTAQQGITGIPVLPKESKTEKESETEKNRALLLACKIGNLKTVKELISQGANIEYFEYPEFGYLHFKSPLFLAVRYGHLELVKFILLEAFPQQKKKPRITDNTGTHILRIAAENNQPAIVDWLFDHLKLDVEWNNMHRHVVQETLTTAAIYGHTEIIKVILRKKFSPEMLRELIIRPMCSSWPYHTLFHVAARNGQASTLQFLIITFPNIFKDTKEQQTPFSFETILHTATSEQSNLETAVLAYHAFPDTIRTLDSSGRSPVQTAAITAPFPVFEFLVQQFVTSIHSKDHEDNTLLHLLFSTKIGEFNEIDFLKKLQLILKLNPDLLNQKNKKGHTPFHVAILNGNIVAVQAILHDPKFIKTLSTDSNGSPLYFAIEAHIKHKMFPNGPEVIKIIYNYDPTALFLESAKKMTPMDLIENNYKSYQEGFCGDLLDIFFSEGLYFEVLERFPTLKFDCLNIFKDLFKQCADQTLPNSHKISQLRKIKMGFNARSEALEFNTALHVAIQSKNYFMIYFLLENDARIDLSNKTGKTALDLAQQYSQESPFILVMIHYFKAYALVSKINSIVQELKYALRMNGSNEQNSIIDEKAKEKEDKNEHQKIKKILEELHALVPKAKEILKYLNFLPLDLHQNVLHKLTEIMAPVDEFGKLLPMPDPLGVFEVLMKIDENQGDSTNRRTEINKKKYSLLLDTVVLIKSNKSDPIPRLRSDTKVTSEMEHYTLYHKIKFLWSAEPNSKELDTLITEFLYGRSQVKEKSHKGQAFHQYLIELGLEKNVKAVLKILNEKSKRLETQGRLNQALEKIEELSKDNQKTKEALIVKTDSTSKGEEGKLSPPPNVTPLYDSKNSEPSSSLSARIPLESSKNRKYSVI